MHKPSDDDEGYMINTMGTMRDTRGVVPEENVFQVVSSQREETKLQGLAG